MSADYRIFVSWSGERSHRIAHALHSWIAASFPALEPWLSSDMEKGMAWAVSLVEGLTTSATGILCVTAEADHDWMAFEAGALLDGSTRRNALIALIVDPDPVRMASSPLGAFPTVTATTEGLRALALDLADRAGMALTDAGARELSTTLLAEIHAIGQPKLRDVDLHFVFPEGGHKRRFAPQADMEWAGAIDGLVDALRQSGLEIARHDLSTFSYLDMRKAEWLPAPKWISSIATDQLAIIHPDLVEGWYHNAKIAAEVLTLNSQLESASKARDRREHIWPDSAFLYAYYLCRLGNHQPQGDLVRLLARIQELPGIPLSWQFEIPMRFLVSRDFDAVQARMGTMPKRVLQAAQLGFSHASIFNGISYFGASFTIDHLRLVFPQYIQELDALDPPDSVRVPIDRVLGLMAQTDQHQELVAHWNTLEGTIPAFLQWLHRR